MNITTSTKRRPSMSEAKPVDDVDACGRCKNQYMVIWLKEGDDYNDFGDRYCPFCGVVTDEFCIPVRE